MYERFVEKSVKVVYKEGNQAPIVYRGLILEYDPDHESILIEYFYQGKKTAVLRIKNIEKCEEWDNEQK